MSDDLAVDGGIYEPIRRKICGEGPCSGENLEIYRDMLQILKLVQDQVAEKCYELGRSNFEKICREQMTAAVMSTGRATLTLRRTEFINKLLRYNE